MGFETTIGARYYFTDNIGLYAETGLAKAVIQAGLYEYAISGKTPENFNAEMFKSVITDKKAKKIFGRA